MFITRPGILAIFVKQLHPDVDVVGLDADAEVLAIAQKDAAQSQVTIRLDRALAFSVP